MIIIAGSDLYRASGKALFLTLGNFDGVHRGHQAMISKTHQRAKEKGALSAAYILNPHPQKALNTRAHMGLLTDIYDRAEIMRGLGLDLLIMEPFSGALPTYRPEEFATTILKERLKVEEVFVGENYRFGYKGEGSTATLKALGKRLGFIVNEMPLLSYKGVRVSSSFIRELIGSGEVKKAALYLNYYYSRYGKVVKGSGIGGKKLLPTANVKAGPYFLWPKSGVYFTAVETTEGELYFGVTNVGPKPTFDCYDENMAETHLLGFSGNLYGQTIRLFFLEKLRDSARFASVEELKGAIKKDVEKAEALARHYKKKLPGKVILCSNYRSAT